MTEMAKTSQEVKRLDKKIKKLTKEIESLEEKNRKKQRAEKIKQAKDNRIKRKKRAVHLFILGNLFKSAGMDHLDEETLIGYCLSFQKINPLKIDQYKIIGKQISAEKQIERDKSAGMDHLDEETLIGYCLSFQKINPLKIDQYKIIGKQISAEKQIERDKEREEFKNNFRENIGETRSFTNKEYSRMIKLGAIFEMTNIYNIELEILTGFILDFKNKSAVEENNFHFY